ncbi:DNA polymerase epsilon subunit 4, partial [Meleagris gallopavo]|uniref:DNA polymerase epsilon subunit 4 n=1 Tax=Meleagris gallopavo TaxID=9103 RepID=UPI00093F72E8
GAGPGAGLRSAPFLRATLRVLCPQELFVETIAKDAFVYAQQGKRKTLQRKDLDNAIEAVDEFAFLEGGAVAELLS